MSALEALLAQGDAAADYKQLRGAPPPRRPRSAPRAARGAATALLIRIPSPPPISPT
jgi:hypothetical protein